MKLRELNFADEKAAIADLKALRQGYQAGGNWTLAQACWHCWTPLAKGLEPARTLDLSAEEKSNQTFLDDVIHNGWPKDQLPASTEMTPPSKVYDGAVDDLIAALDRMASYPHSHVSTFIFGPVETPKFRRFVLIHIAHHLGFFRPGREVKYTSGADVVNDINLLRKGHKALGKWSLAQACWHMNYVIEMLIARSIANTGKPLPPRNPRVEAVIAAGKLPSGVEGTKEMQPPASAGDADIEQFLKTVQRLDGPLLPVEHRIFGGITADEHRALQLIHCAHHFGHFRPTTV